MAATHSLASTNCPLCLSSRIQEKIEPVHSIETWHRFLEKWTYESELPAICDTSDAPEFLAFKFKDRFKLEPCHLGVQYHSSRNIFRTQMGAVVHPMSMHFLTALIPCTIQLYILINHCGTMFLYFQLYLHGAVTMSYPIQVVRCLHLYRSSCKD